MAEKRPPAWKHPEGDEATTVCLAACLDVQLIVDKNVDLYKSIDMKSGLSQQGLLDSKVMLKSQQGLLEAKVMLKSVLEVDPRGGYFCRWTWSGLQMLA